MVALKRLPFLRNRPKDKDKTKACYRRSMCKTLWQFSFFQMTTLASITNFSLTFLWTVPILLFCKVQSSNTRSWKNFFFSKLAPNSHYMYVHWYIYMHMFNHTCNIFVNFQRFLKLAEKPFNSICHRDFFPQRNLLKENITKSLALGFYFLNEPD